MNNISIIISYYENRPATDLFNLLNQLEDCKNDVVIIINSDKHYAPPVQSYINGFRCLWRRNTGMNIGAWSEGFNSKRDSDFYFFFQDECFIKNVGFITACIHRFKNDFHLGMLGESLNKNWGQSWTKLRNSNLNWLDNDHIINGKQIPRVNFYLELLKKWNVNPDTTGLHLRSLFWSFRGDLLRKMNGFHIGANKGECIAAEIATSKITSQLGYKFDQIETSPFCYVGHREWRDDGFSKK